MDLSTKTIIQRIPEVRVYAHIEYDAGYLMTTGRGESPLAHLGLYSDLIG